MKKAWVMINLLGIVILLSTIYYLLVQRNDHISVINHLIGEREKKKTLEEDKPAMPLKDKNDYVEKAPLGSTITQRSVVMNRDESALIEQVEKEIEVSGYSGSILLVKDGEIILEEGAGIADQLTNRLNTFESVYYIASIQKAITATLIMALEEKGQLKLEDTIDKYLGKGLPHAESITIDELLSMTSGLVIGKIPYFDTRADFFEYVINNVTYKELDKW